MSVLPIAPGEFAAILAHVADGITAQAADGRLVYANDAAAQLCGLASAEEMLSLSSAELLERFELLGETGARCRSRSCRVGGRSRSGCPRRPSSATGSCRPATSGGRSSAQRRS